MQLTAAIAAGLVLALSMPVQAACTIGISTPGLLAFANSSPTRMGSDIGTGVSSVIVISNITGGLTSTIKISNPRLDSYPAGFAAGSAVVKTAYTATCILNLCSVTHDYSDSDTSQFTVSIVANLAITIVMNTHVDNAAGFKQGTYVAKTSVDCT
jgi:hypothetical protein